MLFDIVYRHRLLIVLLTLVGIATASFGITQLRVSTDNRIFYGERNPYYKDYLDFEAEFTANDNIVFVISSSQRLLDSPVYPAAIRWLTDEAAALNHVIRVDSLSTYPHPHTRDGTLSVESFLDWACPVDQQCSAELDSALSDSHLTNRLVNPDRTATGVVATVSLERGVVGEIEALHEQSERLAKRFTEAFPGFEVYFTGGVPMMAAFATATADDLSVLLPAALLLVAVLLVLVLGSIKLAATVVLLGLLSIATTLGIAGWQGHILNNATSIVPLIIFTLVVASSMHVAVHFSRNVDGAPSHSASLTQARASVSSSALPITISALTSAASLSSLWFVDSPPLRQLGLLSALGVLIGLYLTLILLPLLLVHVQRVADTRLGTSIQSFVNGLARRQETSHDRITLPTVALLFATLGLPWLEINDDFVKFFDESVPFRVNTDRATELLAGPNHIEVIVRNDGGSVFEPQFLSHLSSLTDFLRTQLIVANAHSFSDVMEEIATAFTDQQLQTIESDDELAQLFLVYELSLQIGQSNTDLVNASREAARISVLLKESTSSEIQALERSIYEWHRSQPGGYTVTVTGENIPVAHLSRMNIQSMIKGIFLSLGFTALVMGMAFRSFRLGLIALLATATPVIAGFGAWAWINNEIGLAATAIIALTIGVVVDDAAHFIYRHLDAQRRLQLDPVSAAAYATHRAGAAIVTTSIVMGLSLSLLLLSKFEVNSSFGAVATLIIGTALVFDLAILPRLTTWATPNRNESKESYA